LAGESANWRVVARNSEDALEDVFTHESSFSKLGAVRLNNNDIKEFTFDPPIPELIAIAKPPAPTPQDEVESLRNYLLKHDRLELDDYKVIGSYVRHEEPVRNALSAVIEEIRVILSDKDKWKARNSFLIWGASRQGKTEFVNQLGKYFKDQYATDQKIQVKYCDLKLSDTDELGLRAFTKQVEEILSENDTRVIAFVDEVDKKLPAEWPFTSMLGPLEWNEQQGKPVIWIFAGSRGISQEEFLAALNSEPGNPANDFINRLRSPLVVIPPLTALDRAVIACSYVLAKKPSVEKIERAALLFLAGLPGNVGEVVRRSQTAVKALGNARTALPLDLCVDHASSADKEFKKNFRSELDSLEGWLRVKN
jgi:hypothetical protein